MAKISIKSETSYPSAVFFEDLAKEWGSAMWGQESCDIIIKPVPMSLLLWEKTKFFWLFPCFVLPLQRIGKIYGIHGREHFSQGATDAGQLSGGESFQEDPRALCHT